MKLGIESIQTTVKPQAPVEVKPVEPVVEAPKKTMTLASLEAIMLIANKNFEMEILEDSHRELQHSFEQMNIENLVHVAKVIKDGNLNNSLTEYLKISGDFESFIGMEIPSITKENHKEVSAKITAVLDTTFAHIASMEGVSPDEMMSNLYDEDRLGSIGANSKTNLRGRLVNAWAGLKNRFSMKWHKAKSTVDVAWKAVKTKAGAGYQFATDRLANNKATVMFKSYIDKGSAAITSSPKSKMALMIVAGVAVVTAVIAVQTMLVRWINSMNTVKNFLNSLNEKLKGKKIADTVGDEKVPNPPRLGTGFIKKSARQVILNRMLDAKSFNANIKILDTVIKSIANSVKTDEVDVVLIKKFFNDIGYTFDKASNDYIRSNNKSLCEGGTTLKSNGWNATSIPKALNDAVKFAGDMYASSNAIQATVKAAEQKVKAMDTNKTGGIIIDTELETSRAVLESFANMLKIFMKEGHIVTNTAYKLGKIALKHVEKTA